MERLLPVIPPHQSNDPTHELWRDRRDAWVKEIDDDLRCRKPFEGWNNSKIHELLKFHKLFLMNFSDSMPIDAFNNQEEIIAKKYGYEIPHSLSELVQFRTALLGEYQKIETAKEAFKQKAVPAKCEPGANYPTITYDEMNSLISEYSSENIKNVLAYLKHKIDNFMPD